MATRRLHIHDNIASGELKGDIKMIEKVIANSFNLIQRPKIDNDKEVIILDYGKKCDLAYLRMYLKGQIKATQWQNKGLQLIASDGDMTIIDIDSLLKYDGWGKYLIEILETFKKDVEAFGLKFIKIKIALI